MDCLAYLAQMVGGQVMLDSKYVGIDDSKEAAYIRRGDTEPRTEKKAFSSKSNSLMITEPYVLVAWWKRHGLGSYSDKLLGCIEQRRFKTSVTGVELNPVIIIEEEGNNSKKFPEDLMLIKIEFQHIRILTPGTGECTEIEC